jgi:hypothetical protein
VLDLALLQQKLGQDEDAWANYKLYLLASPSAPDAESVRAKVLELEYRVDRLRRVRQLQMLFSADLHSIMRSNGDGTGIRLVKNWPPCGTRYTQTHTVDQLEWVNHGGKVGFTLCVDDKDCVIEQIYVTSLDPDLSSDKRDRPLPFHPETTMRG